MRVPFLVLTLTVGAILALPSQIQAQAGDQELPVSVDRISASLKRPPPLQIAAPSPVFRIEVRARPFVLEPVDEKPFDPTFGLPSVGELLMDGIENFRLAAVHYKRRHAERRARKEVDDALAAFCAVRECSPPQAGK